MSQKKTIKPTFRFKNFSFSEALAFLKIGALVYREGWNGKHQSLGLQVPDEHSKMTAPYIFICTEDAKRVPWLASQTDLLANDWNVVCYFSEPEMPRK